MKKLVCILNHGTALQSVYTFEPETECARFVTECTLDKLPMVINAVDINEFDTINFMGDIFLVDVIKNFINKDLKIEVIKK